MLTSRASSSLTSKGSLSSHTLHFNHTLHTQQVLVSEAGGVVKAIDGGEVRPSVCLSVFPCLSPSIPTHPYLLFISHTYLPQYKFHTTGKSNIICGNGALIPEVVAVIEAAHRKMWKKVGSV